MLKKALEVLKIIEDNGYEAYLVGGFVRDYVLGIESKDFDVCTSATPMELQTIFNDVKVPFEKYGAVLLVYKKLHFEITTFRMDLEYLGNRRPSKIMYTNDLMVDLKRRDFTINTLCMDKNGNIIDRLGTTNDVKNHIIKCVGNPYKKLSEDALRILRAIRFAVVLDFRLSADVKDAIIKNRDLLKEVSYYRKKQELNKIFASNNIEKGINILKDLGLVEVLGLKIEKDIVKTSDPLGIWLQVNPCDRYQFTKNEKHNLEAIKAILRDNKIEDEELYYYGTYICFIAAQIMGVNEVEIYDRYDNLPIKSPKDINVTKKEIIELLNLKDLSKLKTIFKDIESKILSGDIKNTKPAIVKYLLN